MSLTSNTHTSFPGGRLLRWPDALWHLSGIGLALFVSFSLDLMATLSGRDVGQIMIGTIVCSMHHIGNCAGPYLFLSRVDLYATKAR